MTNHHHPTRRPLLACALGLVTLLGCKGGAFQDGTEHDRANVELMQIDNAVSAWMARHREPPESLQALVDAKRLRAEQLVDPWGTPYQLSADRPGEVCSHGPDKAPGGGDDLCRGR